MIFLLTITLAAALIIAIAAFILVITALILVIRSFKRKTKQEETGTLIAEPREKIIELSPGAGELFTKHINSLAEAAVILRAEALILFDQWGLLVETYNIAEEHGARAAASLAELISLLKKLGFPVETIILKNGAVSFIVELRKVGDVTPYGLVIGGPALTMNTEYAREILQKYIESIIERR